MEPRPILLIENNLFLGGILSEKLSKAGFELITGEDGEKGLEKIVSDSPSVVILDLPLSDISVFFGVLRKLRNENKIPSPPVIVLSDIESEQGLQRISELGAASYLVKAYTDTDEILKHVKEVLKKHNVIIPEPVKAEKLEAATEEEIERAKAQRSRETKSVSGIPEPKLRRQKKLRGEIEKITILAEKQEEDDLAIVNLIDYIVEYASLENASDIHFKPEQNNLIVRLRIDGVLQDAFTLPQSMHQEVITRIKVLSGMRTDEHQAAQDGRFRTNIKSLLAQFDMRVSVIPTYHGEDAVLRLLVEKASIETLDDIPFSDADRKRVERAISKPYGMILATGPTGSGKTTTLYTILKRLNTKDVSIITIEDPIEYSLAGMNQIQVNARTELTFAKGLRSILRQDPDIIMVGEIRDRETAGIAVNAALTGHKLLSTLHTNDAPTTLPRLLDMGIEPFLIASTVNLAMGQRLVRKLCDKCKIQKTLTASERSHLEELIPPLTLNRYTTFYSIKGCDDCTDGYSGRMGIYEILEIDDDIREAIVKRENSTTIKEIAVKNGMTTLIEDGLKKASEGLTTVEEILRAAQE